MILTMTTRVTVPCAGNVVVTMSEIMVAVCLISEERYFNEL